MPFLFFFAIKKFVTIAIVFYNASLENIYTVYEVLVLGFRKFLTWQCSFIQSVAVQSSRLKGYWSRPSVHSYLLATLGFFLGDNSAAHTNRQLRFTCGLEISYLQKTKLMLVCSRTRQGPIWSRWSCCWWYSRTRGGATWSRLSWWWCCSWKRGSTT